MSTAAPFSTASKPYLGVSNNFTNNRAHIVSRIYDHVDAQYTYIQSYYDTLPPPSSSKLAIMWIGFNAMSFPILCQIAPDKVNLDSITTMRSINLAVAVCTLLPSEIGYEPFTSLFNVMNVTVTDPDIGIINHPFVVALDWLQDSQNHKVGHATW
ncbi:hypothetical protein EV424DRAFT_1534767 [Suillus variegatus]|nr:hypothetical protein EV424DRAFT_1534767 [Suillus variegatus]